MGEGRWECQLTGPGLPLGDKRAVELDRDDTVNVLNVTEPLTFKWILIVCYVNFTTMNYFLKGELTNWSQLPIKRKGPGTE